jgi:hypothetical protein
LTRSTTQTSNLDPAAWRPFNLVIADALGGWLLVNDGVAPFIHRHAIKPGLSMVTAHGLSHEGDKPLCARSAWHLPRFHEAETPLPGENNWASWQNLMADRSRIKNPSQAADRSGAMLIDATHASNFATVSSSLIALPRQQTDFAIGATDVKPRWVFTPGAPDCTPWQDVQL